MVVTNYYGSALPKLNQRGAPLGLLLHLLPNRNPRLEIIHCQEYNFKYFNHFPLPKDVENIRKFWANHIDQTIENYTTSHLILLA